MDKARAKAASTKNLKRQVENQKETLEAVWQAEHYRCDHHRSPHPRGHRAGGADAVQPGRDRQRAACARPL